jgi:hypothetical protein
MQLPCGVVVDHVRHTASSPHDTRYTGIYTIQMIHDPVGVPETPGGNRTEQVDGCVSKIHGNNQTNIQTYIYGYYTDYTDDTDDT